MNTLKTLVLLSFTLYSFTIWPSETIGNSIQLKCEHEYSISEGKQSRLTGLDFFKIEFIDERIALVRKAGLEPYFASTYDSEHITGKVEYLLGGAINASEEVFFNRYTGLFKLSFTLSSSESALTFYGKCQKATPVF